MNDPHVKSLYYILVPGKNADYDNATPFVKELQDFKLKIESGTVIFDLKKHYSDEKEAKEAIAEFITAWKILIGLEHNPEALSFKFEKSEIIDRKPPPPLKSVGKIQASIPSFISVAENITVQLSYGEYPSPPKNFKVTPDVETMYYRFMAFKQNRESLTSMAYMCLTVLEASASGRTKASEKYKIDSDILDNLGRLCSTKGGPFEARKAPKDGDYKKLSQNEKNWIEEVIKRIIRRIGEYAYDHCADLSLMILSEFPTLH